MTLKDAALWLARKIPKSGGSMNGLRAAAHGITDTAENGGDIHFARFAMILGVTQHHPAETHCVC
jgi:hypothetical protein